jgi:hypothetical protein
VDPNALVNLQPAPAHSPINIAPGVGVANFVAAPAPPALAVSGNVLVDTRTNLPVVLRGVNVEGLEGFSTTLPNGQNVITYSQDNTVKVNAAVTDALDNYHANLIRLPVNEDFWLGLANGMDNAGNVIAAPVSAADYQAEVDKVVNMAAAKGAYVMPVVEVSDRGTNDWTQAGQYSAPDANTTNFWQDAAAHYASFSNVLFDPFNEPGHYDSTLNGGAGGYNLTADQWKNAGTIKESVSEKGDLPTYQSPGMQGLINTIRGTGARNVIAAEPRAYANALTDITQNFGLSDVDPVTNLPINNLMYQVHIYPGSSPGLLGQTGDQVPQDLRQAGALQSLTLSSYATDNYPIYVGEWGANNTDSPAHGTPDPRSWNQDMLDWLTSHPTYSWTAWSLNADPTLNNPDGSPTADFGQLVKDYLNPAAPPATPAGVVVQALPGGVNVLTWAPVAGATAYEVVRNNNGDPAVFNFVTDLVGMNNTTFVDNVPDPGLPYFYRVRAFNSAGLSLFSAEVFALPPVVVG